MSNLTPEKYGLTRLERNCLCLLVDGSTQTTHRLLCRLEERNRWYHIADRLQLNYDLVHDALSRLLHLRLVTSDGIFMDHCWDITTAGKQLLKAFFSDGG